LYFLTKIDQELVNFNQGEREHLHHQRYP